MTSISLTAAATGKADAVVVGVHSTESAKGVKGITLAAGAETVDAAYGGSLLKALDALGASGKDGELVKVPSQGDVKAPLIVAVGLGKAPGKGEGADADQLRKSAALPARALTGKAKA